MGHPIIQILIGDVFDELAKMPDESVDVVVTSPPYWGLRDYGVEGQIGMEPTLADHLDVMVRVFAQVWRVLKPTGTVWLNYGDCYATTPNGRSAAAQKSAGTDDLGVVDKPFSTVGPIFDPKKEANDRRGGPCKQTRNDGSNHFGRVVAGGYLKPKDLCMVPNRLAIALQEWGWWIRSEIIWAKPNPMPESVTDRPATSHEKIWLLSKSERYFYNTEAVRQGRSGAEDANGFRGGSYVQGDADTRTVKGNKRPDRKRGHSRRHAGFNDRWDQMTVSEQRQNGRKLRNWEPAPDHQAWPEVWPMATRPFKEAHFATFPPELVRRCLLAGCPSGGKVLDPFGGAGTTGMVAALMGFDCDLIELNPDYAAIAQKRIDQVLLGRVEANNRNKAYCDLGPLFETDKFEAAG